MGTNMCPYPPSHVVEPIAVENMVFLETDSKPVIDQTSARQNIAKKITANFLEKVIFPIIILSSSLNDFTRKVNRIFVRPAIYTPTFFPYKSPYFT